MTPRVSPSPRVRSQASRPWAMGCNAFGVKRTHATRSAGGAPSTICVCVAFPPLPRHSNRELSVKGTAGGEGRGEGGHQEASSTRVRFLDAFRRVVNRRNRSETHVLQGGPSCGDGKFGPFAPLTQPSPPAVRYAGSSLFPRRGERGPEGPAGPSSLAAYQTCRAETSFGRASADPTRDDGLDFAPWHAPQVLSCGFRQGKVLAGRKPLLLFRVVGTLLLRLAERTFDG
jgi:hypothetical protein